ncbi:MAG: type IV secretion system DNA-binding domain-containing protein, partial [Patescibacteria group bacterium]
MPIVLAVVVGILAVAGGVILLTLLWQTIREQASLRRTLDLQMLEVLLPKDLKPDEKEEGVGEEIKARISVAEQFLSTLASLPTSWSDRLLYGRPIVVFEIEARNDGVIVFYAGTERRYLDHLEKQIYAHYPEADVRPAADFTIFEPADSIRTGNFRLSRATHLPIATYRDLEVDPMQALTGALAKIQHKDAAVIQYVLQPAPARGRRKAHQAAREIIRGKRAELGGDNLFTRAGRLRKKAFGTRQDIEREAADLRQHTPRMQQRIELVEQKSIQQQFAINIRVAVSCRRPEEAERVFNAIVGAFSQYDLPDLNSLKLTQPRRARRFLRDVIFRIPRPRTASILSTTELASLFHFPLPTTGTPNILWRGAKIAPAPAGLPQSGIFLGTNVYRGIDNPVHLPDDDRRRHLYLIGQTGTGKTTLFLNMVVQDIQAGKGVGVVDPHGDLIEDILLHVPAERQKDVILFDPRDTERPVGFNMLEVKDIAQRDLVVNEVVEIISKLASRLNPESIGPMFEHYMRNALLALSEDANATLIDVPRMFVDARFRVSVLKSVHNPTVKQFWEQEFAQSQRGQLSADMLSYVISKLGR